METVIGVQRLRGDRISQKTEPLNRDVNKTWWPVYRTQKVLEPPWEGKFNRLRTSNHLA